jgi:glycerol-3-phosphate acyltransferase PlsY
MNWLLILLISYLAGSLPSGYIVARARGIDIRQHGSSNIGTANVVRVMGKGWGYLVFLADFFKGFLAVKVGSLLASHLPGGIVAGGVIAGIACILGHNYPVWLGFHGGKGIATSAGVVLALCPLLVMISLAIVWAAVFFISRYTSLASITSAAALPVAILAIIPKRGTDFWLLLAFSILIAALAIWRHRSNISRLLNGTENRFGKK